MDPCSKLSPLQALIAQSPASRTEEAQAYSIATIGLVHKMGRESASCEAPSASLCSSEIAKAISSSQIKADGTSRFPELPGRSYEQSPTIAQKNIVYPYSTEIEEFRPDRCYRILHDTNIDGDHNLVIVPEFRGLELAAEYYSQKYQTNIEFPISGCCSVEEFFYNIQGHLAKARITEGDHRKAFILNARGPHATPVIYFREGGEESVLYADSLGLNLETVQMIQKKIHDLTGINIYAVENPRQADLYSCFTDALVLCVDATKVDFKTGKYAIPNLLARLRLRSELRDGYFTAKLPNVLLKTAQISAFVLDHQEINSSEIIHKTETFQQFRDRYTEKVIVYKDSYPRSAYVSSYVRRKGVKLAETIEIQFYLKRLKIECLKNEYELSADEEKDFIRQAKMVVHLKEENLMHFSKNFLVRLIEAMGKMTVDLQRQQILEGHSFFIRR